MQPTTPTQLQELLIEQYAITDPGSFINPPYTLGDVFAFTDMQKAVDRIQKAIKEGEHIGIYADYDCDGIPGAVVLVDLFKKLGSMDRVHVYIPDRHDEGYGVSTRGIDALQEKGVTLMITVDVGITALAEIADAQSRGIDVILTDHHAPLPEYPSAFSVIHPSNGTYINQEPCGAAVAFYLVRGFLSTYGAQYDIPEGWEKWLLDLVGFATLSDMVPLTGENRTIAYYGLLVMQKTRRFGLRYLFEKNSITLSTLTETDLTFTVAPRLNAASRMDTPLLAFELLATDDVRRARTIVERLDEINTLRKTLVAQIAKSAHATIEHRALSNSLGEIVVVGNPEWRPAVLGLVANKLVETYGKSFFVWGEAGDGTIKGSCRMIESHHAALLFQALPDGVLLHAGGHQAAGGFSVAKEKIHFFEEELNSALERVAHQSPGNSHKESVVLPLACVTTRHLQVVRTFGPFGVGNPEPVFLFEQVRVISTKKFGKAKEHLELLVEDETGSATAFTFFVSEEMRSAAAKGATISILGTLEAGWRGGVRVRIREII